MASRVWRGLRALAWLSVGGLLAASWLTLRADPTAQLDSSATPQIELSPRAEARREDFPALVVARETWVPVTARAHGTLSRFDHTRPLIEFSEDRTDVVWAEVDGRPRVWATYDTTETFWRDLHRGDRGSDVQLLQRFLQARGHYTGEISGTYGRAVEEAVKRWRTVVDAGNSGDLLLGDLTLFPPRSRVELFASLRAGQPLTATSEVGRTDVRRLLDVLVDVSYQVEAGYSVEGPSISGTITDPSGTAVLVDGEALLRYELNAIPDRPLAPGEELPARIGPDADESLWIPREAVTTDASGALYVVLSSGDFATITMGRNLAGEIEVLEGVSAQDRVLVPHPEADSGL